MNSIELILTDEQIELLKARAVATGEPAEDWPLMAQALLNLVIESPVFDETEMFDGADCPRCAAEESIKHHKNSGRDDECFRCEECDHQWYIVKRIV